MRRSAACVVRVTYDDLPDGLLGFAEFDDKGVTAIVLAKSLDDEGTPNRFSMNRSTRIGSGSAG